MTEEATMHRQAPDRSLEQRQAALSRAQEVRRRRAALRRDLRAGRADVAGLIASPPDWLESMKVYDLLLTLPWWGRVKATKALRAVHVSPTRTLGGLSTRQRAELIVFVGPTREAAAA